MLEKLIEILEKHKLHLPKLLLPFRILVQIKSCNDIIDPSFISHLIIVEFCLTLQSVTENTAKVCEIKSTSFWKQRSPMTHRPYLFWSLSFMYSVSLTQTHRRLWNGFLIGSFTFYSSQRSQCRLSAGRDAPPSGLVIEPKRFLQCSTCGHVVDTLRSLHIVIGGSNECVKNSTQAILNIFCRCRRNSMKRIG